MEGHRPRGAAHLPDRHLGFDVQLSQRPGHRDAVMPVTDKAGVPNLHHGRQDLGLLARPSHAQPATLAVILEWVKAAVKVVA